MLENKNMIDLLGSLKEMSSEQLSRLIQEEAAKECPNDELVLVALDILENREKEKSLVLGTKEKDAWKKYQSKVRARQRKTIMIWKPLIQVASVLVAITLLFTLLPTQANAETWWERLARWTDDFFSFFNPNVSNSSEDEYVFQTENDGLLQVYDAVVELGVTEPVVPMWLPEEYELFYIKIDSMRAQKCVISAFSNGEKELLLQTFIFNENVTPQYYKDDTTVNFIERNGTRFNIMRNTDNWVIIWSFDNVENSIFIDCQEDVLYEIIESIYKWRTLS